MAKYLVAVSLILVGRRLKAPGCHSTSPKQLNMQGLHEESTCEAPEVLGVV